MGGVEDRQEGRQIGRHQGRQMLCSYACMYGYVVAGWRKYSTWVLVATGRAGQGRAGGVVLGKPCLSLLGS